MKDPMTQFLQKPLMASTSTIIFIISHLGIEAYPSHKDVQSLMDLMQPLTPQLLQKPLVVSASAAGHRNRFLEEIKEKRKVAV